MGCASSHSAKKQTLDGRDRKQHSWQNISVPPQQFQSHDEHLVALTSSTYGILTVDPFRPADDEDNKDGLGVESVDEVLRTLNSFETPRSWGEVSSVLENLKPGMEKKKPHVSADTRKRGKSESSEEAIDMDLRDGSEKLKSFDKAVSFHTVEEVDSHLQSRSATRSEQVAESMVRGARRRSPFVQPLSTSLEEGNYGSQSSRVCVASAAKARDEQNDWNNSNNCKEINDSLLDDETRASYKRVLQNLSNDDWNLVADNAGATLDEVIKHQPPKSAEFQTIDPKNQNYFSREQAQIESLKRRNKQNPFEQFERKCPPGGANAVVLYTTSLRGIRQTYEGCNTLRGVLESYGVKIDERDIAMHLGFRNELREVMGEAAVAVPRLFIKGWYIGGVEEASELEEEGKLGVLLEGVPKVEAIGKVCQGCGGARFVPCVECRGSCRVMGGDGGKRVMRCASCNENGLMRCSVCCS